MIPIIAVGVGGFIGSVLRYIISLKMNQIFSQTLIPPGTLLVNVFGSLFLGFIMQLSFRANINPNLRLFLTTGIMGGLTTFSTLSYETITLLTNGYYISSLLNIVLNLILGLSAAFFGMVICNVIF
ncbi:fluoride efflux transporter CrcB [Fervidobacterium nodosum]|uniref:Fluoride-specific ion channel FluC n=1 Tax=Fervidobacterium nodosum (strain ATCC 35602 / DSM 5306 / Rt17-B1) TaxID=381764 RepID=A7HKE3_FERNB|nr:fluoride efflux transporter CrcB [Fervidobacterium nodosum]ABS60376.1 CrcB protein [Fervidobacterium nodosum Rt17-B1]